MKLACWNCAKEHNGKDIQFNPKAEDQSVKCKCGGFVVTPSGKVMAKHDMIKVYKVCECDWIATKVSTEEARNWYLKYCGLDEEDIYPLDDMIECDLDEDGMYIDYDNKELIKELESQGLKEYGTKGEFGHICLLDDWGVKVPFRQAIKHYGFDKSKDLTCIIASCEY